MKKTFTLLLIFTIGLSGCLFSQTQNRDDLALENEKLKKELLKTQSELYELKSSMKKEAVKRVENFLDLEFENEITKEQREEALNMLHLTMEKESDVTIINNTIYSINYLGEKYIAYIKGNKIFFDPENEANLIKYE